ncbi:hypothetical protein [Flavobacterium sp.]
MQFLSQLSVSVTLVYCV